MRRGLMAGSLALLVGSWISAEPLTLEKAVESALSQGHDRVIVESEDKATEASYGATAASFWPSLTVSGSAAGAGTDLTTVTPEASASASLAFGSTSWSFSATRDSDSDQSMTVGLSQNLWDGYLGGQALGTSTKASLNQKVAQLTTQADLRTLVTSVRTSYFTLLSAQEAIAGLKLAQDQANQSLALIQAQFTAGKASQLDLQSAKVSARTADVNYRTGQNTLTKARRALSVYTGIELAETDTVATAEVTVPDVQSVDAAVAYALAHRYELQTTKLTVEAAQVALGLAWADLNPSLDLTASAVRDLSKTSSQDSLSLGVKVSWTVWDSGVGSLGVTAADQTLKAAQATQAKQKLSVTQEVQDAWEDWQLKQESLELAQLTYDNDQALLAVAKAKLAAGTITNADLIDAETTAMDAQSELTTATVNLRLAILTLTTAMGYEE